MPRHVRPTKAQIRNHKWREFFAKWGLVKFKKDKPITPEHALETDPEATLERIVFQEEAAARAEERETSLDVGKLLTKPESTKARKLEAEEQSLADSVPESIGTNLVKDKKTTKDLKANAQYKAGDVLLTGQKVKDGIPKSIAVPASQVADLQQKQKEKEEKKKKAEEAAEARNAAIKVTGNIS
jgi:hypothetical protein